MLEKLKDLVRRQGETGVSKTKVASIAFIAVQLAKLAGYEIPVEHAAAVVEGVLAAIAVFGLYQKVERTASEGGGVGA